KPVLLLGHTDTTEIAGIRNDSKKRGTAMRVVVDLNKCLGYAQCVFLAPTVFKLHGEEALMYDPNPDDANRLKVLRAAAACPVQAILVEHVGDKDQQDATP